MTSMMRGIHEAAISSLATVSGTWSCAKATSQTELSSILWMEDIDRTMRRRRSRTDKKDAGICCSQLFFVYPKLIVLVLTRTTGKTSVLLTKHQCSTLIVCLISMRVSDVSPSRSMAPPWALLTSRNSPQARKDHFLQPTSLTTQSTKIGDDGHGRFFVCWFASDAALTFWVGVGCLLLGCLFCVLCGEKGRRNKPCPLPLL